MWWWLCGGGIYGVCCGTQCDGVFVVVCVIAYFQWFSIENQYQPDGEIVEMVWWFFCAFIGVFFLFTRLCSCLPVEKSERFLNGNARFSHQARDRCYVTWRRKNRPDNNVYARKQAILPSYTHTSLRGARNHCEILLHSKKDSNNHPSFHHFHSFVTLSNI